LGFALRARSHALEGKRIQDNLYKSEFQAHIIDMPYRDVRIRGKLQSRFSYQSNKEEQMNKHELSVYLLTRFGVVCPIQDFC
jgi:hypothetical protein